MTQSDIIPVILSGGSGTRLWPLSTDASPKQFLPLLGEDSMFAMTLGRCAGQPGFAAPIIVSGAAHAPQTEAEMAAAGVAATARIFEPCARNTAPAIALAALAMPKADDLMLVMPSDHAMRDPAAFVTAVQKARALAEDGWLVTFGIEPDGPETGYGYIERGDTQGEGLFAAKRFVEKPDEPTAKAMLAEGGYYWNAGIFLFRADIYLGVMAVHAPDMLAACQQAMRDAKRNGDQIHPGSDAFAACPSDSIDYAVMEKADRVAVVPVDPGWSDVGSWDAIASLSDSDEAGNMVKGKAVLSEATGNLVQASGVTVAMHGVDDLIVVATPDAVLILPRGSSQAVKALANAAKDKNS